MTWHHRGPAAADAHAIADAFLLFMRVERQGRRRPCGMEEERDDGLYGRFRDPGAQG